MRKVIITMLVILILVVPVVAEKKVDAMAEAVVPAMMATLLVVLIAYGISIYDHEAAVEICNDFWNKISDKSKEAIKHYDDEGEITYNSILDREARKYVQKMKSDLDLPGGVYNIPSLSGLEVELYGQGSMIVNYDVYRYIVMVNRDNWIANKNYIIKVKFSSGIKPIIKSQSGSSGRKQVYFSEDNGAYYIGYYDIYDEWSGVVNCGGSGLLPGEQIITLLKVGSEEDNKLYVSFDGETSYRVRFINWAIYCGGLRPSTKPDGLINYIAYEVLEENMGSICADHAKTWDLPYELTSDLVDFGEAVEEGNLDLIIEIPELTDTNDLLGMQLGDLTKITSKTEGLYGLLSRVWQTIKTIARTLSITLVEILQNIYTAITSLSMTSVFEFTVGNTADIVPPNVSLDLVTTRFPFSIPWDLKNIITGLVYTGDLPEFSLKLPGGTFGDKSFSVKVPQEFRFGITFVRTALVIIFIIGLVYTTRRLLGGAV